MNCEGFGHIQAECTNTWNDDEFEACIEGDDICNESMAPVILSIIEQRSSDLTTSAFGPPVDPSTYESPTIMTALGQSYVATTDVESNDDKEISDEKIEHSYKIKYEKLVETVYENRGLLKKISQPCKEKNELVKQFNDFKNEKEESLNELEQIKKTMRMMNSSTTTLDQILLMRRTTKGHKNLGFTEKRSETKPPALTNVVITCRNYHHKGGRKNHSSKRHTQMLPMQEFRIYQEGMF